MLLPAPNGGSFMPADRAVGARYNPPDSNVSVAMAQWPNFMTPGVPLPIPGPLLLLLLLLPAHAAAAWCAGGRLTHALAGKLDTKPAPVICA
jgi:hypothetical protein